MTLGKPTWMQNETYEARVDRGLLTAMYDEGVLGRGGLTAVERDAGANMSVDVTGDTGCVIEGDNGAEQGHYYVAFTGTDNVPVGAAPGSGSRYDRLVIQLNDQQAGGGATNDAEFVIVAGTPSGSPTIPALPASALPIATIGPITSATAAITSSMITDDRDLAGRRDTPGKIDHLAGSKVPTGWLECDGSEKNRADYPHLFAEIGTDYPGSITGTTFRLPDLRGRMAVPTGGGLGAIGAEGGAETVALTGAQSPAHVHQVPSHTHTMGNHTHSGPSHTHSTPNHSHSIGNHQHSIGANVTGTDTKSFLNLSSITNRATPGFQSGGITIVYGANGASLYSDVVHNHSTPAKTTASAGSGNTGSGGASNTGSAGTGNTGSGGAGNTGTKAATNTASTGSSSPHENMPPYTAVGLSVIRT